MREFFIPTKENFILSDDFYEASIKPYLEYLGYTVSSYQKVYSIENRANQKEYCVGGESPFNKKEAIFLILDSQEKILLCTPYHGIIRGKPYELKSSDYSVKEFFDDKRKNHFTINGFTYRMSGTNHEVLHSKDIPKTLYKYYSNTEYSTDAVINQYFFSSHPYNLNDSIDCSSSLWDLTNMSEHRYLSFFERFTNYSSYQTSYKEAKKSGFNFIKEAFWKMNTEKFAISVRLCHPFQCKCATLRVL